MARSKDILPASLPPRGLSREQAAAWISIGPTLFDEMVEDGRMPKPRKINARVVWDLRELEAKFDDLPHIDDDRVNSWD